MKAGRVSDEQITLFDSWVSAIVDLSVHVGPVAMRRTPTWQFIDLVSPG